MQPLSFRMLLSLNNLCPLAIILIPSPKQPLNHWSHPCLCVFPCSAFHVTGTIKNVVLWLASFPWHHVFKVHPCWSVCQNFLWLDNTPVVFNPQWVDVTNNAVGNIRVQVFVRTHFHLLVIYLGMELLILMW